MENHTHRQEQPEDPVTRNGKSKSQQIAETYNNAKCHENSAYLDDEDDSFSEVNQGRLIRRTCYL